LFLVVFLPVCINYSAGGSCTGATPPPKPILALPAYLSATVGFLTFLPADGIDVP